MLGKPYIPDFDGLVRTIWHHADGLSPMRLKRLLPFAGSPTNPAEESFYGPNYLGDFNHRRIATSRLLGHTLVSPVPHQKGLIANQIPPGFRRLRLSGWGFLFNEIVSQKL